ncbi:MAG TPA: ATP-binding cassette domain-containing protein [Polyangia bacterium]|jgi:phospholipid/cholesterol/gamma-HCH transport system ATP-binding protein
MIALDGVTKSFGARRLLDGVDLAIGRGETFGLIGTAGSGKSVLAKIVCRLIAPDAGDVRVDAAPIGMLFQNNALFDFMTVGDNVAFPLVRSGALPADEIRARVAERLRAVGLAGSEDKFPNELSGGMKKRAALARAVIARPPVCIFDEPTAGLDPVTTSKIYDLLRAERDATAATVVVISSDVDALRAFCPRVGMLHEGKLRYDGAAAAIADSDDAVVRQFVRGALEGPL